MKFFAVAVLPLVYLPATCAGGRIRFKRRNRRPPTTLPPVVPMTCNSFIAANMGPFEDMVDQMPVDLDSALGTLEEVTLTKLEQFDFSAEVKEVMDSLMDTEETISASVSTLPGEGGIGAAFARMIKDAMQSPTLKEMAANADKLLNTVRITTADSVVALSCFQRECCPFFDAPGFSDVAKTFLSTMINAATGALQVCMKDETTMDGCVNKQLIPAMEALKEDDFSEEMVNMLVSVELCMSEKDKERK